MKKIFVLILIFCAFTVDTNAQRSAFGVRAGYEYNIPLEGVEKHGSNFGGGFEFAPFEQTIYFEIYGNIVNTGFKNLTSQRDTLIPDLKYIDANLTYFIVQSGLKLELNWDAKFFYPYLGVYYDLGTLILNRCKYQKGNSAVSKSNPDIRRIVGGYHSSLGGFFYLSPKLKMDSNIFLRYMPEIQKSIDQKFLTFGTEFTLFYMLD